MVGEVGEESLEDRKSKKFTSDSGHGRLASPSYADVPLKA